MSCRQPEISEQILAWLDGVLPAEDADLFATHIAACPWCQQDVQAMRELTGRVAAAYRVQREQSIPSLCPNPDDLQALADKTVSSLKRHDLKNHLAICPSCQEQVELLRALDADAALSPTVAALEAADQPVPSMPPALRQAFEQMARASGTAQPSPARGGILDWLIGSRSVLAAFASVVIMCGVALLFMASPQSLKPPPSPPPAPAAPGASAPTGHGSGGAATPPVSTPAADDEGDDQGQADLRRASATPPAADAKRSPANEPSKAVAHRKAPVPAVAGTPAAPAAAPKPAPPPSAPRASAPPAAGERADAAPTAAKAPAVAPPAPPARPAARTAPTEPPAVVSKDKGTYRKAAEETYGKSTAPPGPVASHSTSNVAAPRREVAAVPKGARPAAIEKKDMVVPPSDRAVNKSQGPPEQVTEATVPQPAGTAQQDEPGQSVRRVRAVSAQQDQRTVATGGAAAPRAAAAPNGTLGRVQAANSVDTSGYRLTLESRARHAVAGLVPNGRFNVRVTLTPSGARNRDEASGLHVDVALSEATDADTVRAIRDAVTRALDLRPGRGDSVTVSAP